MCVCVYYVCKYSAVGLFLNHLLSHPSAPSCPGSTLDRLSPAASTRNIKALMLVIPWFYAECCQHTHTHTHAGKRAHQFPNDTIIPNYCVMIPTTLEHQIQNPFGTICNPMKVAPFGPKLLIWGKTGSFWIICLKGVASVAHIHPAMKYSVIACIIAGLIASLLAVFPLEPVT